MGTGACIKRRLRALTPKDTIKPERAVLFLHASRTGPVPVGEPCVPEWAGAIRSPWPTPAYQEKLFKKQQRRERRA